MVWVINYFLHGSSNEHEYLVSLADVERAHALRDKDHDCFITAPSCLVGK